ncbi:MAG TPA: LamG-like jellyroll fold domain-containing protein [Candidatus Kryptonia bacterium]
MKRLIPGPESTQGQFTSFAEILNHLRRTLLKSSLLSFAITGLLVCSVHAQTIWSSSNGTITFTKANYADYTQAASQDRITDNVWITRADNQQIFNIKTESSADGHGGSSPAGTEWAIGTTADFSSLTFTSWGDAITWVPPLMVGKDMVVHLIADNIYIDIKFLSWSQNSTGGGFSYVRAGGPLEAVSIPAPLFSGTSETLSGQVFSSGSAATAYVLLGTASGNYTDSVLAAPSSIGAGTQTTVSADFSGLDSTKTYYFCTSASNGVLYKRSAELRFSHPKVWSSSNGTIIFTKAAYADYTQAASQDRITDDVWITRGDDQQIFNIKTESSADGNGGISPAGTEWAIGTTADISSLTFTPWGNAIGWHPPGMLGKDMVVHLTVDNIYIDIKFLSWTGRAAGGGFSYVRAVGPFEVSSVAPPLMTGTSETLSGQVFTLSSAATAYILLGTSSGNYTDSLLATPNSVAAGTQTTVSADFSELDTTKTYYFCVAASNGTLYKRSAERSFSHFVGTIWSSSNGTIIFTKADYADYTQAVNQDRITDSVWITRANSQQVFNIKTESSADGNGGISPTGTEWAIGTTTDLASLTFGTWYSTVWSIGGPLSAVGHDMVVHLIADNIYIDIKFLSWTYGNNGGGFSYVRAGGPLEVSSTTPSHATRTSVTVGGKVFSLSSTAVAYALYGTTSGAYTDSVLMTPSPITAGSQTDVSANLSGLNNSTAYYYCTAASNGTLYKRSGETIFATQTTENYALEFDGTDDYVSLPANLWNNNFSNGTAISVEYWFKGTWLSSPYRAQDYSGNYFVPGWENTNDGNIYHIISNDGGTTDGVLIGSISTLNDNQWHHIAMTWQKAGLFTSYLDGVQVAQRAAANVDLPAMNVTNYFGAYFGNAEFLSGLLDEVRIWNVVRSQVEIQSTMNDTLTGTETGLVGYWQFNESGTTTTAYEQMGLYNGTLNNFAFSGDGWVTDSDLALPVQATDFVAKADIGSVTLSWKTGSEVNNAGFNILRRDAGIGAFISIGGYTTNAALKGMGTSTTGRSYTFTDTKVRSGAVYDYKIQCATADGIAKDVTTLTGIQVEIPKDYALYQNYPNPFNPSTTIRFDLKESSTVTLEVYNMLGQRVMKQDYGTMNAGRYNENINMGRFTSGVYYYRIDVLGSDGQKFVSIKKMLEMK